HCWMRGTVKTVLFLGDFRRSILYVHTESFRRAATCARCCHSSRRATTAHSDVVRLCTDRSSWCEFRLSGFSDLSDLEFRTNVRELVLYADVRRPPDPGRRSAGAVSAIRLHSSV